MFSVLKSSQPALSPRLGRLALPGRKLIETPHYLAITSRGVVPHITQDTFRNSTNINGAYVPLEDFIERAPHKIPPIYLFKPPDGSSPLRAFIALPEDTLLVLGARRTPPVVAPAANPNTNTTVSVCTAVGFRILKADDYSEASEKLKPDVVVGLGDIPYGRTLGSKRIEKATDRQIEWMQDHIALRTQSDHMGKTSALFAPLLPVSCANQEFYTDFLASQAGDAISGLAFYNLTSLEDLPHTLQHHPRLAFTVPNTPQQILQQISLGLDIFTVPFVGITTDAGIALNFTFPAPFTQAANGNLASTRPLGIDMWLADHATDLSPLVHSCQCYACTNHHRAYIQHLLAAKEMLGWVLLQIHNHHILDLFFAGIRNCIARDTFEADMDNFSRVYDSELPEKTGKGPRVRGYHFKSEGPGEPKRNTAPYVMLDDGKDKVLEAELTNGGPDRDVLELSGLASKDG